MKKVFIAGNAGTTGLRINERLKARKDIEIIVLEDEKRKDTESIKEAICRADVSFLCLPDSASKEIVEAMGNTDKVIIDTSTAFRTSDDWTYGFPEIDGRWDKVQKAKRIANPGCHASGFISLVAPLAENGILKQDAKLTSFSITGYSGGGKKMIAQYETETREKELDAPRQYGITQNHKHLPEMTKICNLKNSPIFCPIVSDYYAGMEVTVSLFKEDLSSGFGISSIKELYAEYYNTGKNAEDGLVRYAESCDKEGFISAGSFENKDSMAVTVVGNEDRILLVSLFDNLGKGASGAAIQNMNLSLGLDPKLGLIE